MLKSLRVQHFRSLTDVSLKFSPITILVGQNGSGKSNVVDALRFVRDSLRHSLDHAISERGGIDVLRQYSPTRPYAFSIELHFEYEIDEKGVYPATYSFKVVGSGSNYRVESEEATWFDESFVYDEKSKSWTSTGIQPINYLRDKAGKILINNQESKQPDLPVDQLGIRSFYSYGDLSLSRNIIVEELMEMRFASIYPNILREPSRPDTDRLLKENCANWASVLKAMRQRKVGEQMMHKVMELMRQVMPGLEQVTVKLIGGYLVPQFLVKETDVSKAHYFDPVQLSDGTLRMFAIFLSLYQIPAPGFFALEEPELTIHPGLIGLLADAFKEVSQNTQLLITTHSPYLLDHFGSEVIRVVSMSEGQTGVYDIRRSQLEAVKERLMTLSEVMALDGLRPE